MHSFTSILHPRRHQLSSSPYPARRLVYCISFNTWRESSDTANGFYIGVRFRVNEYGFIGQLNLYHIQSECDQQGFSKGQFNVVVVSLRRHLFGCVFLGVCQNTNPIRTWIIPLSVAFWMKAVLRIYNFQIPTQLRVQKRLTVSGSSTSNPYNYRT